MIQRAAFFHLDAAAASMSFATASGCDIMTTCEAPLTTTVCFECARSAMKACACGGMFLSWSP